MKRSTDRILTSHAGALHGTPDMIELSGGQRGQAPGPELAGRVKQAVADVVRLQKESGVDVVNDGEYTKGLLLGWMTYARTRLGGIEQRPLKPGETAGNQSITAREQPFFPDYFSSIQQAGAGSFAQSAVYCVGPLSYTGLADTQRDIEYLQAGVKAAGVEEAFISALAPGTIEHWLRNEYYKTEEEFLFAIADAMHDEYRAIADAGIIVQLDDPGFPDGWQIHPELSVEEYRSFLELRVEATNHAVRDIPEELVRMHMCWGSSHHPHTQDLPLERIIDLVYKVKAQCYSIEARKPATRARVGGVQGPPLAGRQDPDAGNPGSLRPRVRRAPAGRCAAPRALRERCWPRERQSAVPIAASPASPTRQSCGQSSAPWAKVRRSPVNSCGHRSSSNAERA
jgi:5-methyltetrahydropteroyltriglutamate--homocysteine methyltransferase